MKNHAYICMGQDMVFSDTETFVREEKVGRVFEFTDADSIRLEEQKHEKRLKKYLQKHGIDFKNEDIRPHGIRLREVDNTKNIFKIK